MPCAKNGMLRLKSSNTWAISGLNVWVQNMKTCLPEKKRVPFFFRTHPSMQSISQHWGVVNMIQYVRYKYFDVKTLLKHWIGCVFLYFIPQSTMPLMHPNPILTPRTCAGLAAVFFAAAWRQAPLGEWGTCLWRLSIEGTFIFLPNSFHFHFVHILGSKRPLIRNLLWEDLRKVKPLDKMRDQRRWPTRQGRI